MSKGSASPPPAPDPHQTYGEQTNSNIDTAIANRVNQYSPWGSSEWAQQGSYFDPQSGRMIPMWSQTRNFNPTMQRIFEGTQNTAESLLPAAKALAKQIAG